MATRDHLKQTEHNAVDILTFKVGMANLLANSFLFTHQADAEQNQHSFVSQVSPDEWKTDIPSVLALFLVSSQCNTMSLLFSCQMIYFCSQAKFDTRSAYTCFFESFWEVEMEL